MTEQRRKELYTKYDWLEPWEGSLVGERALETVDNLETRIAEYGKQSDIHIQRIFDLADAGTEKEIKIRQQAQRIEELEKEKAELIEKLTFPLAPHHWTPKENGQ